MVSFRVAASPRSGASGGISCACIDAASTSVVSQSDFIRYSGSDYTAVVRHPYLCLRQTGNARERSAKLLDQSFDDFANCVYKMMYGLSQPTRDAQDRCQEQENINAVEGPKVRCGTVARTSCRAYPNG